MVLARKLNTEGYSSPPTIKLQNFYNVLLCQTPPNCTLSLYLGGDRANQFGGHGVDWAGYGSKTLGDVSAEFADKEDNILYISYLAVAPTKTL